MLAIFSIIGSALLTLFRIDFDAFNFPAAILSGIIYLALIGQWAAYFSLGKIFYTALSILFFLVILGILKLRFRLIDYVGLLSSYKVSVFANRLSWSVPTFCSFLYMTLAQGSWTTGQIAYRSGPDTFGWSDAVNFFRDNLSLPQLKQLIISNLHGTPLYSALNVVHPPGTTAIYQIPSFTRQIDAEFLLGAHRTGVPYLLGTIAHLLPTYLTGSVLVAFLMISIFLMSQISVTYFAKKNQQTWFVIFGAIAVSLNCNLLFQTLEGGVGELFSIPFLLLPICVILNKPSRAKEFSYSIGLLLVIALTSYFDIIFTALPILGMSLLYEILRNKELSFFAVIKSKFLWISLILGFVPFATSFIRLAVVPFLHPSAGGWDIGRKPFPDNTFGMLSSLPVRTSNRSTLAFILEGLFSLVIILFVMYSKKGLARFGFLVLLAMYGYLFYSVYHLPAPYNNYRLWKFSAIASSIFPFFLVKDMAKTRIKEKFQNKSQLKSKTLQPPLSNLDKVRNSNFFVGVLITSTCLTSLSWILDWQSSKKISFNTQEQNFISQNSNKYDFYIDGSIYSAMVTMYGDVHYATPQRGLVGEWTLFSSPVRPIMFLTNSNCTSNNPSCLPHLVDYSAKLTVTKWEVFRDFTAVTTKFIR
jgi:hypothetical protein